MTKPLYDITTLLQDPLGLGLAIDSVAAPFKHAAIDVVVGIESRGFIFGSAIADRLQAGQCESISTRAPMKPHHRGHGGLRGHIPYRVV